MFPQTLDNIFPFIVLGYGALVTAVLHSPLITLAEGRLPETMTCRLVAHRTLSLTCLLVGFGWSMQNLWLNS